MNPRNGGSEVMVGASIWRLVAPKGPGQISPGQRPWTGDATDQAVPPEPSPRPNNAGRGPNNFGCPDNHREDQAGAGNRPHSRPTRRGRDGHEDSRSIRPEMAHPFDRPPA